MKQYSSPPTNQLLNWDLFEVLYDKTSLTTLTRPWKYLLLFANNGYYSKDSILGLKCVCTVSLCLRIIRQQSREITND